MAELKLPNAFRVDLIESERGWGSKIDEIKYFDTEQEAKDFVRVFNSKNTADVVPDWYMYADYRGRVS